VASQLKFHISYKNITSSEMNEHLKYLKDNYYIIRFISYEEAIESGIKTDNYFYAYLKINFVNITLTFKRNFKWENYRHNLSEDEDEILQDNDPASCFASLQRSCHFPSLEGRYGYGLFDGKVWWNIPNLGGIKYVNKRYVNKRYNNCICYDRNSAFSYACVDLVIPNTSAKAKEYVCPCEGEIGFTSDGVPIVGASNIMCRYVFPSYIDENLTNWAKKKYKQKKNAKTEQEKQNYKNHMNYAIGCLARHNPFIRNCIIHKSNELMMELIDENTLMSNTDSIVSLVERKDLKMGGELGEFKIEHTGNFALIETGYQWNYDNPSISGFVKKKAEVFEKIVGRKYDILRDGLVEDIFLPRSIDIKNLLIYTNDVESKLAKMIRRRYNAKNS